MVRCVAKVQEGSLPLLIRNISTESISLPKHSQVADLGVSFVEEDLPLQQTGAVRDVESLIDLSDTGVTADQRRALIDVLRKHRSMFDGHLGHTDIVTHAREYLSPVCHDRVVPESCLECIGGGPGEPESLQVVVPLELVGGVLTSLHAGPCGGHFGPEKLVKQAQLRQAAAAHHWPVLRGHVTPVIRRSPAGNPVGRQVRHSAAATNAALHICTYA